MKYTVLCAFVLSGFLFAALEPVPIPRTSLKHFQSEGVFEGGKDTTASIVALRFSPHPKEGFERWVLDFGNEVGHAVGEIAPHFQVRYQKGAKIEVSGASDISLTPAKFILTFQKIKQNRLKKETLQKLVTKSRFVKEIVLFPPIEDGDTAVEFTLKDNVLFETHQPKEKEGRLVLDLKNAPLGQ